MMSVVRRFLDKLERRLLLRSMGIDEAAADRPAPPDEPIRERLIEVKTTHGWQVWRREDIKNGD